FITMQLYENGFEAFRLPADFGLDLVVTNQFKTLDNREIPDDCFPFGLQVKSRRLRKDESRRTKKGRDEYNFYYLLKNEEIETLKTFPNSAYVFVFLIPFGISIKNIYAFCIHSNEIDNMIKHKFFIKSGEGYKLNVRFRGFPQESREKFIKEMLDISPLTQEGKEYLESNLPGSFQKNWNASEYVSLGRESKKNPDKLAKKRVLLFYDFSKFPHFEAIEYL
ncbi:MAG: hypothetical protein WA865_01725, partial [Spirulinaceae cyanobacterium]